MTAAGERPLTFKDVDGLAFAACKGRLDGIPAGLCFGCGALGPFLELSRMEAEGLVPSLNTVPWLRLNGFRDLYGAMSEDRSNWVCSTTRRLGMFRTASVMPDNETPWIGFSLAAQQAATASGFPRRFASQLVAAMGEMHSNVYEHSAAPGTGLIAFQARGESFEFVVADAGRGVLESLRSNPEYSGLSDYGEALRLALSEGVSRFGSTSGRGWGFRPLFVGLANRNAFLRFRSGDHALLIDGDSPALVSASIAEKPPLDGCFASVTVRLEQSVS